MKSKTQKRAFVVPTLSTWIPHKDDNVEDPGATIMRFGKWKGKTLGEIEKKDLRAFKKNYRLDGKGKGVRESEEGKWLWPLLHYFEQFKAKLSGAEGDHEIPSAEELNERRDAGVINESNLDGGVSLLEKDTDAPFPRATEGEQAAAGEDGSEAALPTTASQSPSNAAKTVTKSTISDAKPAKESRKRKNTLVSEENSEELSRKEKKARPEIKVEPEAFKNADTEAPRKHKKKSKSVSKGASDA